MRCGAVTRLATQSSAPHKTVTCEKNDRAADLFSGDGSASARVVISTTTIKEDTPG